MASLGLVMAVALGAATPALAYTEHDVLNMPGHGQISPSYLVVHSTANPGATAQDHVSYWTRMGNGSTMAHWVMDWTDGGTVYQMAASDRLVWHVGNGNRYSVGIELCEATDQGDFDLEFDQAARWCADFLRSRGWGLDRMVSHNEARQMWGGTDHTDPTAYFARFGQSWATFEARVSGYLTGSSVSAVVPSGSTPSDTGLGDREWWGQRFTRAMQEQLGTEVDGYVSRQPGANSRYLSNADSSSWLVGGACYTPGGYSGSMMVKDLQAELAERGYYSGAIDGWAGYQTITGLQRLLIDNGYSCGPCGVDGSLGPATCQAVASALDAGFFRTL